MPGDSACPAYRLAACGVVTWPRTYDRRRFSAGGRAGGSASTDVVPTAFIAAARRAFCSIVGLRTRLVAAELATDESLFVARGPSYIGGQARIDVYNAPRTRPRAGMWL